MEIGTFEAKTHFSEIIDEVQKGSNYVVTKRGTPVARIVPFVDSSPQRKDIIKRLFTYQESSHSKFDIREAIKEGRK